jgi:hypothetical protein
MDAQLLLHHRDAERRVGRDLVRELVGEGLQLLARHHVVDEPELLGALDPDRLREAQVGGIAERQEPADIVGDAEPGRGHRERGVGRGNADIARERQLARAAPHAAFDHGDHGGGEGLTRRTR